jgi:hypothetical protein
MLDFKSFISVQKAMWVKRITKEGKASWKAYPNFILNKLIGPSSFNCNLDINKNWNIKGFYWSIIKNWNMLNEKTLSDMDVMNIRRQCIWLNQHIKVNKQEIKWQTWIQNGIILIHDIVTTEGKFISLEEHSKHSNIIH